MLSMFQARPKISLQLLRSHHASDLYRVIDSSREHLTPWLEWVNYCNSEEDSRKFIDKITAEHAERKSATFGIWQSGNLLGVLAFRAIDWDTRIAEIGYWLGKEAVGKGVVTKACAALIELGFRRLGLSSVIINCRYDNVKSCAVPQRLHFPPPPTTTRNKVVFFEFAIGAKQWELQQQVADTAIATAGVDIEDIGWDSSKLKHKST